MKIISKVKDYFHYLQGVLGMDEKIVLDYSEFYTMPYKPSECNIVRLFICDYLIEGYYKDGQYYFFEALEEFANPPSKYTKPDYYFIKNPKYRNWEDAVLKKPKYYKDSLNRQYNCPILLVQSFGDNNQTVYKFPILKEYNLQKYYPAIGLWNDIYNWMSVDVNIPDKRSNNEKILSNGFDLKESFRNYKR